MNTEELAKVARAAQQHAEDIGSEPDWYQAYPAGEPVQVACMNGPDGAHIAAWSPERALAVLAVVEAAQLVIALGTREFAEVIALSDALKALEAV